MINLQVLNKRNQVQMAKDLKSIEEIHDTVKRRVFADDIVPQLIGLDNQIKYEYTIL